MKRELARIAQALLMVALVILWNPRPARSTNPPVWEYERHIIPIPEANWINDRVAERRASSDLGQLIRTAPFGGRWPETHEGAVCRDFLGDAYGSRGIAYWVYRCQSTRFGGGWFEDYYFLGDDTVGTLERITWVAESAKPRPDWYSFVNSLVDTLTLYGGKR